MGFELNDPELFIFFSEQIKFENFEFVNKAETRYFQRKRHFGGLLNIFLLWYTLFRSILKRKLLIGRKFLSWFWQCLSLIKKTRVHKLCRNFRTRYLFWWYYAWNPLLDLIIDWGYIWNTIDCSISWRIQRTNSEWSSKLRNRFVGYDQPNGICNWLEVFQIMDS